MFKNKNSLEKSSEVKQFEENLFNSKHSADSNILVDSTASKPTTLFSRFYKSIYENVSTVSTKITQDVKDGVSDDQIPEIGSNILNKGKNIVKDISNSIASSSKVNTPSSYKKINTNFSSSEPVSIDEEMALTSEDFFAKPAPSPTPEVLFSKPVPKVAPSPIPRPESIHMDPSIEEFFAKPVPKSGIFFGDKNIPSIIIADPNIKAENIRDSSSVIIIIKNPYNSKSKYDFKENTIQKST